MKTYLITGCAGFIGSNFVHYMLKKYPEILLVNLDKLTYAGNLENLKDVEGDPRHVFVQGDICDKELVESLFAKYDFDYVINFAAESHVDRSIHDPDAFVRTNVLGTCTLLRGVLEWWKELSEERRNAFRFLHVSTDEVYGTLRPGEPAFTETTPYAPNSPYSASKASSDHFVRAYHETYGLPTLITNCSNNYGPRQFPEKLIPLVILNALSGKPLPIYGTGENIRDWLHVEDHCEAIVAVLEKGAPGECYNIGGHSERANIDVVRSICRTLDKLRPTAAPYEKQITFVADRPGHDLRYANRRSAGFRAVVLRKGFGKRWAGILRMPRGWRTSRAGNIANGSKRIIAGGRLYEAAGGSRQAGAQDGRFQKVWELRAENTSRSASLQEHSPFARNGG